MQPAIAISQQDSGPEVIHFTAGDRTIDGAYGATIAAVVRAYVDNGYERPEKECEVTAFGMGYKVLKGSDVTEFYTDAGQKVFDVENVRLEKEYQYWHRNRSQQEPETAGQQILPEKSGKCIYRPEFECTLEEAHKLTPGTGEDCSQACCWDCVRRGDCKLECYSSERRPEVAPEEHGGESAAEVQQEVEDAAEMQQEPEAEKTVDVHPEPDLQGQLSEKIQGPEGENIGGVPVMFVELDRIKEEYAIKYPPKKAKPVDTYDKSILQSMIKFEEDQLRLMGPAWMEKQPYHYTKHTMALEAYRMLLAAHEGAGL